MVLYQVIFNGDRYFGMDLFKILNVLNKDYGPFEEDIYLDNEDNSVTYTTISSSNIIEDSDWVPKDIYWNNKLKQWIV